MGRTGGAAGVRPAAPPPRVTVPPARAARGTRAQAAGLAAEAAACAALVAEGWTVLARRLRTAEGEVDVVAERAGLLALVEVKRRFSLADAACALGPRQRRGCWRRPNSCWRPTPDGARRASGLT